MEKAENFREDCKILVDLFEFIGAFNCKWRNTVVSDMKYDFKFQNRKSATKKIIVLYMLT